ncbi:MAG: hypothetical protein V4481_04825 [Patescibacteria group bacterium]
MFLTFLIKKAEMQKVLRVNSKYKLSGTNSNFVMAFDARDLDWCQSITLLDAVINRTFPNIYAPINVIALTLIGGSGGVNLSVTIPPLQYTATTLAAAMQVAIRAADPGLTGVSVTYLPFPDDRFQFTWDGTGGLMFIYIDSDLPSVPNYVPESTISTYIGMTTNLLLVPSTPISAASQPQLQGPDEVYIQSNLIAGPNCVDVAYLGGFIPYLGKINFAAVPYGFSGTYQSTQAELQQINYKPRFGIQSVRTFDVQITDRYGNILPIPDNCFVDMHLAFMYEPNQ